MKRIGIIGGGAAGMTAAIAAAGKGREVTILEANDRLGKKILATGNGKCNLGNEQLGPEEYYTGDTAFLERCLGRFGTSETLDFFGRLGLVVKSRGGYLYPASEQAAGVLDVLRYEIAERSVKVVTGAHVEKISRDDKKNCICVQAGDKRYSFDRVILACGGKAAPKTGSDGSGYSLAAQLGHSIVPTVPALVQLKCREEYLKAVSGVRAQAKIVVSCKGKPGRAEQPGAAQSIAEEQGEVQFTDYGISGIPVFQVSRQVNYWLLEKREVEVILDFFPDYDRESWEQLYINRALLQGQRTVEEFFTGMLNKKLMLLFLKLAGLKPSEKAKEADREKIKRVFSLCRCFTVHVVGNNGFENAQVCAGGVPLSELRENLESARTPGVFFAGELLDVDGKCGGYNLQWAWCSGFLAGTAAAGETEEKSDRNQSGSKARSGRNGRDKKERY